MVENLRYDIMKSCRTLAMFYLVNGSNLEVLSMLVARYFISSRLVESWEGQFLLVLTDVLTTLALVNCSFKDLSGLVHMSSLSVQEMCGCAAIVNCVLVYWFVWTIVCLIFWKCLREPLSILIKYITTVLRGCVDKSFVECL